MKCTEAKLSGLSPRANYADREWPEFASELYRPSDRLLSAKLAPTFAVTGRHVVRVTDLYGRNLGFLDRSRFFFFFQVVPHEAERTPFQTHYFSEYLVAPGIEPRPLDL
jgi:hypothetical protein